MLERVYPGLNDVWTNHLVPFLLPSKEQIKWNNVLVQFVLRYIYVYLPSHPRYTPIHVWYVQPSMICLKGRRNIGSKCFTVYHVNKNVSCCCRMVVRHDRLGTRDIYTRRDDFWSTLFDDGQIWWTDLDDDDPRVFMKEVPSEYLHGLCPHIWHHLLMHAIRHKVHTVIRS
jgi:hypothetical protein